MDLIICIIQSLKSKKSVQSHKSGESAIKLMAMKILLYGLLMITQFQQMLVKTTQATTGASATADTIVPIMVKIKGGTFQMGSEAGGKNTKPVHKVKIATFYLSQYEVTNAQYCAFLNVKDNQQEGGVEWIDLSGNYLAEKCRIQFNGNRYEVTDGYDNYPVLYVSWYGAVAYCAWLSERGNKRYRLPTEAEWEYAAKGGQKTGGYTYSGSNDLGQVGWFWCNSGDQLLTAGSAGWSLAVVEQNKCRTHPVGQKNANELGLYDMSGNVAEWCSDWVALDYYQNSPSKNPKGPTNGTFRVCRGGAWHFEHILSTTSVRYGNVPTGRRETVGFRVAQYK